MTIVYLILNLLKKLNSALKELGVSPRTAEKVTSGSWVQFPSQDPLVWLLQPTDSELEMSREYELCQFNWHSKNIVDRSLAGEDDLKIGKGEKKRRRKHQEVSTFIL